MINMCVRAVAVAQCLVYVMGSRWASGSFLQFNLYCKVFNKSFQILEMMYFMEENLPFNYQSINMLP